MASPQSIVPAEGATSAAVEIADAMMTAPVMPGDYLVVLPVVIPFLFGALLLMLRRRVGWQPWIALSGLGLLFLTDLALLSRVVAKGPQTMVMGGWLPPFGIAFTVDLLGALFVTAAGFVTFACGIYAVASVSSEERRYGFFPFLFLMIGGVSGAFVTGDIFNLYVWFEVLLIGSFGLIVLGSRHEQLDGATKYCFLNLIATTLFLIATAYLYGLFGTLNMADITVKAAEMEDSGPLLVTVVLFLIAFSMKAAAFPLNNWLPASYHTPRFVVSALFAGLLTKVGIYALIRTLMMLFPLERQDIAGLIGWVAALTMMIGALGALAQTDLRRLLNYMVIAGVGTILVGLSIPAGALPEGAAGASALQIGLSGSIFYALHSIVVMTALYLAAGVAASRSGSPSLAEMGGLWARHPFFSAVMLIFLFAVSGLPPFSGFWPKVVLVRASLAADLPWLGATVLVSGFLLTIASARVFALAFWRPRQMVAKPGAAANSEPVLREHLRESRAETVFGLAPLLILVCFVIIVGVWPEWLLGLATEASASILDPAAYISSVFAGGPPA